ncbi:TPA: IclR family transcriptional regulator [Escherichia coli]|jgi:DNA-binding IclR family transcriptional regulator|uniref:IclR family transcriptional regulator n=1 Tax=Citrobacter TaxID=544 RepID=UPI0015E9BE62|nr:MULTISPECIES: IclR family transcriptional regulator [Citrobacter]MBA8087360.1 IclR family transcriptional regulator [Citrobacter sp. RHBSTW-00089]MBD9975690.1 IclR family transcriptional regulator [Citrobacter braakii]MBJ9225076.1 IclR family transcriptional regulator [Citrobacter braakii]MBS9487405.1 IclR family transcriptional regulator [Citrobacter braakii]MDE9658083.1 IclR family transcriptional regulator [Citrobacter braakii]
MDAQPTEITGVQTLLRGLAVIDAVASGCRDLRSVGEFTGTSKSTTHRLLSALVQQRFLRFTHHDGYALGPRLIELGTRSLENTPLYPLARPFLQQLADFTRDTVHLGQREGAEVLYIDKIPGQQGLEMRSRIGHRMPLVLTGIGKALLLDADESEWRQLFLAHGELCHLPDFLARMRGYADAGFAFDLEENEPTIRCVAAPVYDAGNHVVAAISVASTVIYMPDARMQELVPHVKECAKKISQELGWRAPSFTP